MKVIAMTKFFGLKLAFPLFLVVLTLSLPALTYSVPDFLSYNCDKDYGNYTNNSTYQTNLETLLFSSSFPSLAANSSGFYNLSAGQAPDRVYAMAQCRGDLNAQECRGCIANATSMINKVCPNRKKAIGVYEQCSLRYSSKSFYGILEEEPLFTFYNGQDASNVSQFSQAVINLFERLQSSATSSNNKIMFATGEAEAGPSYTIYAMAQCSRDISRLDCGSCLENSIQTDATMYPGTIGLALIKPGCNMRYSVYPAYRLTQYDLSDVAPAQSPSPPSLTDPPTTNKNVKKKKSTVTIVAIVGAIGASLIMILSAVYFFLLKRRRNNARLVDDAYKIDQLESLQFDFETVKLATDNFSDENKLGQGGFGAVYKGTLPNGQEVAVKRLSTDSMQGESEFKNEVLLVAKLQHRNLVRIVGFCVQGEERLLLYEFVPNSSLDRHLFDHVRRENLDWVTRHKIIDGIARGILYLHEDSRLRIIHRDLKASNVLLDEEMNPKISDFGMARLFAMDQTRANTNRVVGTFGYMAPEYVTRGRFSVKSDVFSFGVLVLEIASGQQNNGLHIGEEAEDLLTFAWRNWQEGTPTNIIYQDIRRGSTTEMIRWIHIALLCVQENEAERPTMAQVFVMLNSYSLTLPVPARPAFFMHSTRDDLDESRSEGRIVISSENEATMTDPFPR